MESFNQVMPLNEERSEFGGYINALNEEFYVYLKLLTTPSSKSVQLRGCSKMQELLKPLEDSLEQRLCHCDTVKDMLLELQSLLEHEMRTSNKSSSSTDPTNYLVLLNQLQECGWDKVRHINSDLDCLHLKALDEFEREHILKIWILEKFPNVAPKCEYDLPGEISYKWNNRSSLLDLFNVFKESLTKYLAFWNNMDEIDENTWVLEPEKPTRKDCKRRIAIAPSASLLIIVDPSSPSSVPVCHYLGPERIVAPVREQFIKNIYLWNEYDSLLTNLKSVLEMEFPSPSTSTKDEFCIECGICYSYQLGDAIPNMTCEDPNCNQPFHHVCLYEYVRTLPNARHGFNKLFGECPYCSKTIWCTIPS